MAGLPAEQARGVGDAALVRAGGDSAKLVELSRRDGIAQHIGIGQVSDQRNRLGDRGALLQPPIAGLELVDGEAQPMHSGVHLGPDAERRLRLRVLEQIDLPGRVDQRLQPVAAFQLQLFGANEPFQHRDALTDSGFTETHPFIDPGDRERVDLRQMARNTDQTMPVGVRFHHRHDPRTGRMAPQSRQVVLERREIQLGIGGRHHAQKPSLAYGSAMKFSNRVYCPRKVNRVVPIGPFRCFAMMISAVPLSAVSGW